MISHLIIFMNEKSRLPRCKELKNLSSALRNNATKEENKLWYEFLRTYPIRFNRQRIIGSYIVDFYCAKAKIVISAVSPQSAAAAIDALENAGLSAEVLQVSASHGKKCGGMHMMLADNSVYIISSGGANE